MSGSCEAVGGGTLLGRSIDLRRSKAELRAAERDLRAMHSAQSFHDLVEAWQEFLNRIERTWIKCERECQPVRSAFEPWQGIYKHQRRTDPLLAYLLHARNADQHTVQPVAGMAVEFSGKIPPAGTAVIEFDRTAGRLKMGGQVLDAVVTHRYALLPVDDRGVVYPVPGIHRGLEIESNDPFTVAKLGLAFYAEFIDEAAKRFSAPQNQ